MLNYQGKEKLRKREKAAEPVRLGVVGEVKPGGCTVRFDGEETASGKVYPAIYTGVSLVPGDRIACLRARGSYIILGKYGG